MSSTGLKINLPNAISLFRVMSVIPVVVLLSVKNKFAHTCAGIVFLIASFTDLADGFIARRRGEVTLLGKLIDPLADKILLLGAVLPLVEQRIVPAWLAIVMFSREFTVTGFRALASTKGRIIPADIGGKIKTLLYTVSLFLLMVGNKKWGTFLLYIGVLISILSASKYIADNLDIFGESQINKEEGRCMK